MPWESDEVEQRILRMVLSWVHSRDEALEIRLILLSPGPEIIYKKHQSKVPGGLLKQNLNYLYS